MLWDSDHIHWLCHFQCMLIFSGTERAAGHWVGPLQENSGWRGHSKVEDQIYTAADWGNNKVLWGTRSLKVEFRCQRAIYTSATWGHLSSCNLIVVSSPVLLLLTFVQTSILAKYSNCLTFSFSLYGLSIQAAKRGLLSTGRGRGVHSRGRGSLRTRGRGSRGRGRNMPHHAVVDHRPRAMEISGFTEEDCVNLLPHFAVSHLK